MDIAIRTKQLNQLFSYERKVTIADSRLEIIPYVFTQQEKEDEIVRFQQELATTAFCPQTDDCIHENKSFTYIVFHPQNKNRCDNAIILLHGLNERSWDKYLTWSEYLSATTGKPVILFPIAFHMNRTPAFWCNPRETMPWAKKREKEVEDLHNSTFANVALSSRISRHPLRFYASGRESAYNLCQLVREIKNGKHPLFKESASVDLFAYSIGALLSQVILLANPDKMFTDSRLFMFCGGSIFNEMNGNSRDILDKDAYDRLLHYYTNDFLNNRSSIPTTFREDELEQAFRSMIRPDYMRDFRETFFSRACNRIRSISLKKDKVVPTTGIIKALGKVSGKILEELDFPFTYTHQIPFPQKEDPFLLKRAFHSIFDKAAAFLA